MLIIKGFLSYPSPRARMWDSSSEGIKTLRNSAEKMPPFFMAPVFLMLSVTERRGWRKWNSLKNNKHLIRVNILQLDVYLMQKGKLRLVKASHIIWGYKVLNLEKGFHFFNHIFAADTSDVVLFQASGHIRLNLQMKVMLLQCCWKLTPKHTR